MKRLLLGGVLVLIVLVIGGFFVASFFLGSIIKKGVETAGPNLTKSSVQLSGASLAPFSGSGELTGLIVGNPEGFKTPSAIQVGSIAVQVVPGSVLSDKVVVRSVRVLAPEVTFEGGIQGNNLSKLLENIRSSQSSGTTNTASSRKIQLDDLLISGGKLHLNLDVLGTRSVTVPLPEIHLSNLGQGPEGITAAELSEKLLRSILENATKAAAGQVTALGKDLGTAAQSIGTNAAQQVEKVTKGLGDLFKKK